MLTIGMFWTVIANLVVLPSLLVVSGVSPAPRSVGAQADESDAVSARREDASAS
jgi:hypothetical protein